MQEHILIGRIAGLVIFRVPEFGTRASFTIEGAGRYPVVCAVEGDVAREFIARYCEGDEVGVRGIYEPRPSTAAANTPWVARFRVQAVVKEVRLAAWGVSQISELREAPAGTPLESDRPPTTAVLTVARTTSRKFMRDWSVGQIPRLRRVARSRAADGRPGHAHGTVPPTAKQQYQIATLEGCTRVKLAQSMDPNDSREEGMRLELTLAYDEATQHPAAATPGTALGPPKEVLEGTNRAATLRRLKAVQLLALPALFFLTGGAMTEAQELLAPVLSPQPRGATSAATQGIEKLRQRPITQSPRDTASLPLIGSISAGSDIRPFLSASVPADVTRAALRRAWSVDPAIRDFIGLSENSWDFNAASGVPGFGSLTAEDARRLLARVMDEKESLHVARPLPRSPRRQGR
jgi:hypothetical protein